MLLSNVSSRVQEVLPKEGLLSWESRIREAEMKEVTVLDRAGRSRGDKVWPRRCHRKHHCVPHIEDRSCPSSFYCMSSNDSTVPAAKE